MLAKLYSCLLLISIGCSTVKEKPEPTITITGTALNAKAGAIVMSDKGMFYIDGLHSWDEALYNKRVTVTGTPIKEEHEKKSTAEVQVQELVGTMSILKNAKWELAKDTIKAP
jgi:hypothetical protein